jgi:hypothetical protein
MTLPPEIIKISIVEKIELDYDKSLKNNSEITIKGILKNNKNSSIGTEYVFSVSEIDDILSYVNTFSTEDFSMTLPPEIIKSPSSGLIIFKKALLTSGSNWLVGILIYSKSL